MSNNKHPLSPLSVPDYDDSTVQIEKWESARVEYTIKRLKLGSHVLKELHSQVPGGKLSFADFNNRFPTFPMLLAASSLHGEKPLHRHPKGIHPMWFKSFTGLPFIRFYEEELERHKSDIFGDESRVLGMVFPRKGFAHGLIIHNGEWQTYLPKNSGCHLYQGGKIKSMTLLVQPFTALLDHVLGGLHWEPANP